ncbi:MAG: hypothetical protein ACREON_14150, partial [Gemmatimonadaceae bacterium]
MQRVRQVRLERTVTTIPPVFTTVAAVLAAITPVVSPIADVLASIAAKRERAAGARVSSRWEIYSRTPLRRGALRRVDRREANHQCGAERQA